MRILVDADACPVKAQILSVARRHACEVVLIASHAHRMPDLEGAPDVAVIAVESSPQAVDIALTNASRRGDVVVTGDYGLACMVLGRGVRALSFRGQVFDDRNIDGLMATRHLASRVRRGGGRMRGPKAFTAEDAARFEAALERMITL